ncbi:MAG: hypothetical protein ACE5HY_05120 [Candidatus Hydrothermarchaeales archaeon]
MEQINIKDYVYEQVIKEGYSDEVAKKVASDMVLDVASFQMKGLTSRVEGKEFKLPIKEMIFYL